MFRFSFRAPGCRRNHCHVPVRGVMLLLAAVLLAACGDSPTEPPGVPDVTGTWSGNWADDVFLVEMTLTHDTLQNTIHGSASFELIESGGISTQSVAGTYNAGAVSLTTSTLQGESVGAFMGTHEDDTITGALSGIPLTLRLQPGS